MKVRLGFVSNSSSSSYTCDYCGETEAGFDVGLSEFELVECTNGHICCEHHLTVGISDPKVIDAFIDEHPNYADYDRDDIPSDARYEYPAEFCPLCNFEAIGVGDLLAYYRLRFGLDHDEVLDDIKSTFGTYDNFMKAVRDAR